MDFKTESGDSQFIKVTAEENGMAIGRVFLYLIKNDLHREPYGLLEDAFVEEEYRSRGVGTQLVQRVIEEARKRGCYKLVGNSRFDNEQAHKFYERLGFAKHGYELRLDLE